MRDLYYIVSVLLCLLEQNAYFNVLQTNVMYIRMHILTVL